jgi:hypothetical protein
MPRIDLALPFFWDEEAQQSSHSEGVLSPVTMPQCLRQPAPLFKKLDERAVGEKYAPLAG